MTNLELLSPISAGHRPDYDLSSAEMSELFVEGMRQVAGSLEADQANVLVVQGDTELANYGRSLEAKTLPTIPNLMADYEDNSRFVYVLQTAEGDTPTEHDRPAHVFRINYFDRTQQQGTQRRTGLPTFDDLLKLGKVSEAQLLSYYGVDSLQELGRQYINVESNIAVDGVKASIRNPYSALGYKAFFKLVDFVGTRGIVAYQNEEAIGSLGHMKLVSHPIVGDQTISVVDEDKMNRDGSAGRYFPLTLEGTPYSKLTDGTPEHNHRMFADVEYASSFSRLAGVIAKRSVHILFVP